VEEVDRTAAGEGEVASVWLGDGLICVHVMCLSTHQEPVNKKAARNSSGRPSADRCCRELQVLAHRTETFVSAPSTVAFSRSVAGLGYASHS
jgi:hypothetical protein